MRETLLAAKERHPEYFANLTILHAENEGSEQEVVHFEVRGTKARRLSCTPSAPRHVPCLPRLASRLFPSSSVNLSLAGGCTPLSSFSSIII